jgi:hypothetical protein
MKKFKVNEVTKMLKSCYFNNQKSNLIWKKNSKG